MSLGAIDPSNEQAAAVLGGHDEYDIASARPLFGEGASWASHAASTARDDVQG
jgi:hypothetical protein